MKTAVIKLANRPTFMNYNLRVDPDSKRDINLFTYLNYNNKAVAFNLY